MIPFLFFSPFGLSPAVPSLALSLLGFSNHHQLNSIYPLLGSNMVKRFLHSESGLMNMTHSSCGGVRPPNEDCSWQVPLEQRVSSRRSSLLRSDSSRFIGIPAASRDPLGVEASKGSWAGCNEESRVRNLRHLPWVSRVHLPQLNLCYHSSTIQQDSHTYIHSNGANRSRYNKKSMQDDNDRKLRASIDKYLHNESWRMVAWRCAHR